MGNPFPTGVRWDTWDKNTGNWSSNPRDILKWPGGVAV